MYEMRPYYGSCDVVFFYKIMFFALSVHSTKFGVEI